MPSGLVADELDQPMLPQPPLPAASADAILSTQITDLEQALDEEIPRMRRWWWSWVGIYGGLTALSAAGAFTQDDPARQAESVLNASGAALGALSLVLRPPASADSLERVRRMPATTSAEQQARLNELRQAVRQSAHWEAGLASWITTVAGVVVSAGLALPLWLKYDRPDRAGINLFTGVAINQLQIYSQPKGLMKFQGLSVQTAPGKVALVPSLGGLAILGSF